MAGDAIFHVDKMNDSEFLFHYNETCEDNRFHCQFEV